MRLLANPSLHVIARAHTEADASGLRNLGADDVSDAAGSKDTLRH